MSAPAPCTGAGVAPAMPPTLAARELSLRAGERSLLAHFTHTFCSGQLWCVAGPNGAGKTTLLATLAGLRTAHGGQAELDGIALPAWPVATLARRRAWMPQSWRDAFAASVLDTVLLGRHPYLGGWGWEQDADRAAARAALAAVGLEALAERDVMSLSGGERQRVALAAVLCQDAPLMLLDEPLAHLDLHHQVDCLRVLAAWAARPGRTIIFSCHDLNLARRFASHAVLLDGAGHAYCGAAREVLSPALASRAFGHPLVLVTDGLQEALVPDSAFDGVKR